MNKNTIKQLKTLSEQHDALRDLRFGRGIDLTDANKAVLLKAIRGLEADITSILDKEATLNA